jgi:hypothetical protein
MIGGGKMHRRAVKIRVKNKNAFPTHGREGGE